MKLKPYPRPRAPQRCNDFLCGKIFRINYAVHTHVGHMSSIARIHKIVSVDSRYSAPCTQITGYRTGHYIIGLERCHGYEEIAAAGSGLPQSRKRCRVGLKGHKIVIGVEDGQLSRILIHQTYILFFCGEQFCQMRTDLSRTCYHYLHRQDITYRSLTKPYIYCRNLCRR